MTSGQADEFNSRMKEADGTLSDKDELNREGETDRTTSMVQASVEQARWYYYHVSTP